MFCRKCGKSLLDGDRFCSYCGAQVIERRESLNINENVEEVVYNRAHFEEAAPKAEVPEVEVTRRSIAETWAKPGLSRNTRPYWNLEGFPVQTDEPRKTEDIYVDWEKRELPKREPVLTFVEETETAEPSSIEESNEQEDIVIKTKTEPALSFAMEPENENKTPQAEYNEKQPLQQSEANQEIKEEPKKIDIFEIFDRQLEEEKKENEKKANANIEDRGTMVFDRQDGKLMLAEKEKERKEAEEAAAKHAEELEKEIFGNISSIERRREPSRSAAEEQIDKFYTFSQKNEEFQRLLDREYERLKGNIGAESKPKAEPKSNIEENHISIAAEPIPVALVSEQKEAKTEDTAPSKEETFAEKTAEINGENPVPPAPTLQIPIGLTMSNPEKGEKSEDKLETKEEVILQEENLKEENLQEEDSKEESEEELGEKPEPSIFEELEKADIFSGKDIFTGLPKEPEAEPTEQEIKEELDKVLPWDDDVCVGEFKVDEKKSSPVAVFFGIVAAVLVIEAALVGIKYFLPESNAAKFINENLGVAVNWVDNINKEKTTQDQEEQKEVKEEVQAPEVSSLPNPDKNALIEANIAYNENIVQLTADDTLVFDENKDYGDELINNSKPIENNIWYTDENGNAVFYDNEVVKTIIQFDSSWIDYVNGENDATLGLLKEGSLALENAKNYSKVGKVTKTFDFVRIGEIRQRRCVLRVGKRIHINVRKW